MDGGSWQLLGLIYVHRGAVEYDLRHRFGLGLRDIGDRITLAEVARLVTICRADPSSAIAAALEGWTHPISREALILMDLFDVTVQVNTDPKRGRPKPHSGRPFEVQAKDKNRMGRPAPQAEVAAILNRHGHNLPV